MKQFANASGAGNVGVKTLTINCQYTDFTDGGSTSGTFTATEKLPQFAFVLGSQVKVLAGFAGDSSATLKIGDGSDVDRYNTGTPSVFATAATGVAVGIPSGAPMHTAAVSPVLTVTSGSDFTAVTAGELEVTIYYV